MNISTPPNDAAGYARDFITTKNQVEVLYSHANITFSFPLIAAGCLAGVLWDVAARWTLLVWLGLVIFHTVARYALLWKYLDAEIVPANASLWLNRFLTSVLISGALWGIAGIVLVPYDNSIEYTLYNGLTVLIICGLVSGALISYAVNIWVLIAYSFPALVPPAIHLISLGDRYNSAFGGFILLYYFFIGVAAARMNKLFSRYLEMDCRHKELAYRYERLQYVYSEFRRRIKR
jgi:hypothetical protein